MPFLFQEHFVRILLCALCVRRCTSMAVGLCGRTTSLRTERIVGQGRLNEQQLKDLSEELASLTKHQSEARLTEVFIRMSAQEIKAFDLRKERISKIYAILSEHDAKRIAG